MTTFDPSTLKYDSQGLIPAIIQDVENNDVLMLGFMNAEAVRRTLNGGRVTFWSRSRQEYWRKGDTSGHAQLVRRVQHDCDADTLLIGVEQIGAACHTGSRSCFEDYDVSSVTDVSRSSLGGEQ
jgi:phosphoribosyl-AMP cyclohydrolase